MAFRHYIYLHGAGSFFVIYKKRKELDMEKILDLSEELYLDVLTDHTGLQISANIGGTMAKNEKNTIVIEVGSEKLSPLHSDIKEAKQQILIVDDSQMNRELLAEMLQEDFKIMEAENGKQAVEILQKHSSEIALVLLDIIMPVMNGFEVLEVMNEKHMMENIPVIMISTENTDEIIRQAYELGVSDYINRPFDARIVYRRVNNTIKLYAKQRRLINLVKKQVEEKENNNQIMISILSHIVEFRNGESGAHVLHINILTEMLLERLMQKTDQYPLTWTERHLIPTASALHDIGKIGIEEKILNKPGKLTKEEFEIMKTHTLIGADMLKDIQVQYGEELVKIAYEICRWHHERYDGRGYPDGLKGEEIPISAQVVSLADVYDALVSERVYKKAFSHETAIEMIKNGECGIFNPILMECMLEIQDKMREAYHIK